MFWKNPIVEMRRLFLRGETVLPSESREKSRQTRGSNSVAANLNKRRFRRAMFESMEPRLLMTATPIQVGSVYIEEDIGTDAQGDLIYIQFQGGAENTTLDRVVIDGDQGLEGFNVGDNFFDIASGGLGADESFPFSIVEFTTIDPSASVRGIVNDGETGITLEFENFQAGDLLVLSIDVDEVEFYDPDNTPDEFINDGFDPITSGVEFQGTHFEVFFSAPNFFDAEGESIFINRFDDQLAGTGLDLPEDNVDDQRDRTAGTALSLTQQPLPVSLAGTVYVDNNLDLNQQIGEQPIPGVSLELLIWDGSSYVDTGHRAITDSNGDYLFGTDLGLGPGTYQVREQQPIDFFSVGAVPGQITESGAVIDSPAGQTVTGDSDVLTEITILRGNTHAENLDFAEAQPTRISGFVYVDSDNDGNREAEDGETGIAGVTIRLEPISTIAPQTSLTTVTDSNGFYSFDGLVPGQYRVIQVTQPEGFFDGLDTPGTVAGQTRGESTINEIIDSITLQGNDSGVEFNFGELPPASIRGSVCLADPGTTCFSDTPEQKRPIADVRIDLIDELTGQIVATTTTDENGDYAFIGIAAGRYTIVEFTPENLIDGSAQTGTIDGQRNGNVSGGSRITGIQIGFGDNGVDFDFCEVLPSSLSGQVFEDANDDGIRQDSEPLLPNVEITLRNASGDFVASTTTDENGFYEFTFLGPGTYELIQSQPDGFIDGRDIAGTINGQQIGLVDSAQDTISQIELPSGTDGINYDFGEIRAGSIAGRVITDFNGNKELDAPGERALENVEIELLDSDGNVIARTSTDSAGRYRFDGLRPGTYSVREIQPEGFLQGGQRAGSGGGDDSQTDIIRAISIGSGDELINYDFCELPPSELAGSVFVDNNGDCVFHTGDRTIEGVRVDLMDANGNILATTFTDANGNYRFTGLRPGTYSVREFQPDGFFQGSQSAGSGGGDDSIQDLITSISVGPGETLVNYDFCELEPAALAGSVFISTDGDCFDHDQDDGLSGVGIELLDASGNVIATTSTDANGNYSFENLRPGNYSVREIQPDGFFQGGQSAPDGRANTGTLDLLSNIELGSGESLTNLIFCEEPPAAISGFVFQDGGTIITNDGNPPEERRTVRDGQRTADDTPLAGVQIELRTITGQLFPSSAALPGIYDSDVISVETDENGFFEFTGLRAGVYHIYQQQPDGFVDSLDTPGSNGGFSLNPEDSLIDPFATQTLSNLTLNSATDPGTDAILLVQLAAGQIAVENNFSEILVERDIAPPPPEPPEPEPPRVQDPVANFERSVTIETPTYNFRDPELVLFAGPSSQFTWHLSVINAGTPRGDRPEKFVSRGTIARASNMLDVTHWTVAGLNGGRWHVVSTNGNSTGLADRNVFTLLDAIPLAGDFNGDGIDELALFHEGEWLLDVNGNGRWDNDDLWARLGDESDLPVIGDWDADGKDDIGIYGPEWVGDRELVRRESGLPDSENQNRRRPKNIPESDSTFKSHERLMQRSRTRPGRSDVIDHVFRFGEGQAQPIAGDFNGDGIPTVGIMRNGNWRLDSDGNGVWDDQNDQLIEFGQTGDIAVVGDFDGDGVDEIAIVRGSQVIVDSNHNGRVDATDRVFQLEQRDGTVVIGDFDGDGIDEPILHAIESIEDAINELET